MGIGVRLGLQFRIQIAFGVRLLYCSQTTRPVDDPVWALRIPTSFDVTPERLFLYLRTVPDNRG